MRINNAFVYVIRIFRKTNDIVAFLQNKTMFIGLNTTYVYLQSNSIKCIVTSACNTKE